MPEQPPSQAQDHRSDTLLQERESSGLFTMIYIDQSYAVYNNYHNSQNQTITETINSNNVSSTQARNSSLNGGTRWTFRTNQTHGQSNSIACAQCSFSSPLTPDAGQGCPHTPGSPGPGYSSQYPQWLGPLLQDMRASTQTGSELVLHEHTASLPPLLTWEATVSVATMLPPLEVSRNMRRQPIAFCPACHFFYGGL
ncbi:hypothetical protein H1R20_g9133, partial [Candolleomyces eurysporus]